MVTIVLVLFCLYRCLAGNDQFSVRCLFVSMNYRFLFFIFLFILFVAPTEGQTKIGDRPADIHPGAVLELESLSKGFRLSRIKLDDVNAWTLDGTAVSGMLIFNDGGAAPRGMYYWSVELSRWVRIVNSEELASIIISNTTISNNSVGNKLSTTVNGITGLGVDIINNNSLSLVNGILTSTVNGVVSSPGLKLISSVDNGLSDANGNAQLGGPLIKPTILAASSVNTLALTGLDTSNDHADSVLVVTANTGVLRKVSRNVLVGDELTLVTLATSNGQRRFATPAIITNPKKIQVYRNGINVEFDAVDDTHIDLEMQAACYMNDEIKITQMQ